MPSVSRLQQKAMHAAAEGRGNIGIPQKVGAEFAAADHARGPTPLPMRITHPHGLTSHSPIYGKHIHAV